MINFTLKLKKLLPPSFKKIILLYYFKISLTYKKIKRLFFSPEIPKNKDGKVLIHLGCGEKNTPGWINVDLIPLPHIHFIQNVISLPNFPNNFADIIYASHILEHISHLEINKVLKEWRRVLKPNGLLRLSVPDFDKIIQIYQSEKNSIRSILEPLMGGQDYEFNFHKNTFNKEHLSSLLKEAGFKEIKEWDPKVASHHTFNDWSSKFITIKEKKYSISLNLEAINYE